MDSPDLSRVQQDLNLIKSQLGDEFPYDRRHVLLSLLGAGAGVIIALSASKGLQPAMRSILIVYFLGFLGFWGWHFGRIRSERVCRPKAWRWTRRETAGSLVTVGLLILYVLLTWTLIGERQGWDYAAWRDHIAGPLFFFTGVGLSAHSVGSWERLAGLGIGLSMALGGLIVPWSQNAAQTRLVLGFAILIGGVASAILLYWQIRRSEAAHAAD